jgi:hypothetical protein
MLWKHTHASGLRLPDRLADSPASFLAALQRIEFARTKSDAVAKLDGSYKPDKDRKKKGEAARGEQHTVAEAWGDWKPLSLSHRMHAEQLAMPFAVQHGRHRQEYDKGVAAVRQAWYGTGSAAEHWDSGGNAPTECFSTRNAAWHCDHGQCLQQQLQAVR